MSVKTTHNVSRKVAILTIMMKMAGLNELSNTQLEDMLEAVLDASADGGECYMNFIIHEDQDPLGSTLPRYEGE